MLNIADQKRESLNDILNAWNVYKGGNKTNLEKALQNLLQANKLTHPEYEELLIALTDYKNRILFILASSTKVRVNLGFYNSAKPNEDKNLPFKDLENEIWKPL